MRKIICGIVRRTRATSTGRETRRSELKGGELLLGEFDRVGAGHKAQRGRSAYREAVTCFQKALAALHPLPDTRQKIERAIDLRLDLRS